MPMSNKQNRKAVISLFVMAIVSAVAFTMLDPWSTFLQTLTLRYDTVPGRVEQFHPKTDDELPKIEYSFEYQGRKFYSDRFSFVRADSNFEFDATLGQPKIGAWITVFVDPKNPQQCVLLRGLSSSALFWVVWCAIAVLGFCLAGTQFLANFRSSESYKSNLDQRVEFEKGLSVCRIRMVPGNFTPRSAGLTCFAAVTFLTLIAAVVGERIFELWNIGIIRAGFLAFIIGTICGLFDYRYTLAGNRRGRWDLIVDLEKGILQIPAIGAYGEPSQVSLDDITGISCEQLIASDENELYPLMVLQLHLTKHGINLTQKVAVSNNRPKLEALGEWVTEVIGLPEKAEPRLSAPVPAPVATL